MCVRTGDDGEHCDRFADTGEPVGVVPLALAPTVVRDVLDDDGSCVRCSGVTIHHEGRGREVRVGSDAVSYAANLTTTGRSRVAGYFELYQDKAKQYRFRLKAGNHEIVATSSESYPDKTTAQKGIDAVKNAANGATVKEV
jgi:uncharacterized protein